MFDVSSLLCVLCFCSINTLSGAVFTCVRHNFHKLLFNIDQITVNLHNNEISVIFYDNNCRCQFDSCTSQHFLMNPSATQSQLNTSNCIVITSWFSDVRLCREFRYLSSDFAQNIYKSNDRLKCLNVKSTLFHISRVALFTYSVSRLSKAKNHGRKQSEN